jgi:hypothetical protein
MHKEILTQEQIKLLPLLKSFKQRFGLVGGTAIALQIGHRHSIDFDLFSLTEFKNFYIKKIVTQNGFKIEKTYQDETGQFTFFINNVQFTFFHYPFKINFNKKLENYLRMPDLETLAAMKAYALGRRAKWKDYVDLYFILKNYHPLEKIVKKSKSIFQNEFNERIIREQISYFKDINYSEKIEFMPGFEVSEEEIKKSLVEFSLE